MGSHWQHTSGKSSLLSLAVLNGGDVHLPVSLFLWPVTIKFLGIFLKVDCFKWVLNDGIGQGRVPSFHQQFHMRGPSTSQSASMTCNNEIPWYFLISWLFQIGSHWWYRTAKSSLFSPAVLHGGIRHWPKKAHLPNLSSFLDLLLLHRAPMFLIRNERPINSTAGDPIHPNAYLHRRNIQIKKPIFLLLHWLKHKILKILDSTSRKP